METYKDKLLAALDRIEAEPVCLRTIEQATAVVDLLCALGKLEKYEDGARHFDRDEAMRWAAQMENEDGSTGAHWTMAQTDAVADNVGLPSDIPRWAFGVAMNMMYSDYYAVAQQFGVNRPEFYAELAKAFLMDKDGPGAKEKLMRYYCHVVK